jgi:copper(I)-binding protein
MKKMHSGHTVLAAAAASFLLLGGCGGRPRDPNVEEAWVRLPATSGQPGAAYFRLEGNIEGTRLTGITSPLVRRIELHETVEKKNGVTGMEKRKEIDFPYRGALVFEPGGRHAMLFGINKSVKAGGTLPLTFSFNTAPPVTVDAEVRTPTGESHKGH